MIKTKEQPLKLNLIRWSLWRTFKIMLIFFISHNTAGKEWKMHLLKKEIGHFVPLQLWGLFFFWHERDLECLWSWLTYHFFPFQVCNKTFFFQRNYQFIVPYKAMIFPYKWRVQNFTHKQTTKLHAFIDSFHKNQPQWNEKFRRVVQIKAHYKSNTKKNNTKHLASFGSDWL